MTADKEIALRLHEHKYLSNISELSLLLSTARKIERKGNWIILYIPAEVVSIISSKLTERLAAVGFDEVYELTEEGKTIQSIIDRMII